MPTDDQLRAIMPALPEAKRQTLLPFLQQAIDEFAIAAPARQAAFLAQLAHESGQFRFMEEIWGPTPAQLRYEPVSTLATRLGNTQPGDGKRFKGRGPIQLTGRANYQRFGSALGLDLVADPPRAATPEVAFRIAGLFWQRNGLNDLADQATPDAFRRITRRINGGENGLADRERFYAVARQVFEVADPVTPGDAAAPTPGPAMATRGLPTLDPDFERGFEAIVAVAAAEPLPARAKRRAKKAARKASVGGRKRAAKKTVVKRAAAGRRVAKKKAAPKAVARKAKNAVTRKSRKAARKAAPKRRLAKKR
jgi:putative chitinase